MRIITPDTQGAKTRLGGLDTVAADTPFQNLTMPDMASNARLLSKLGDTLGDVAVTVDRRKTERSLLEVQDRVTNKKLELLDPHSGILTRYQGDAVGLTRAVEKEMGAFKTQLMSEYSDGMSHSGKMAMESFLTTSGNAMVDTALSHETREDAKYEVAQIEGNITKQVDLIARAPRDEGIVTDAMSSIVQSVNAMGNRTGAPQDMIDAQTRLAVTSAVAAQVNAIAPDSPTEALGILEANKDEMDMASYQEMHDILNKDVKKNYAASVAIELVTARTAADAAAGAEAMERAGARADTSRADLPAAVATAVSAPPPDTKITYNMGPRRPYAPDNEIINIAANAVYNLYGAGYEIVIGSGQEGDNPQHGADRHITGKAMDFYVVDPNGKPIKAHTSPKVVEAIMMEMARLGATGLGAGKNKDGSLYQGGNIHGDIVDPNPAKGQGHLWASLATGLGSQLLPLMNGPESQQIREDLGLPRNGVLTGEQLSAAGLTRPSSGPPATYVQQLLAAGIEGEELFETLKYINQLNTSVNAERSQNRTKLVDDLSFRFSELANDNDENGTAIPAFDAVVSMQERRQLGSSLATVEAMYNNATGTVRFETDDELLGTLRTQMMSPDSKEQATFMQLDLAKHRSQLDDADYAALRESQRLMVAANGHTPTTLQNMEAATPKAINDVVKLVLGNTIFADDPDVAFKAYNWIAGQAYNNAVAGIPVTPASLQNWGQVLRTQTDVSKGPVFGSETNLAEAMSYADKTYAIGAGQAFIEEEGSLVVGTGDTALEIPADELQILYDVLVSQNGGAPVAPSKLIWTAISINGASIEGYKPLVPNLKEITTELNVAREAAAVSEAAAVEAEAAQEAADFARLDDLVDLPASMLTPTPAPAPVSKRGRATPWSADTSIEDFAAAAGGLTEFDAAADVLGDATFKGDNLVVFGREMPMDVYLKLWQDVMGLHELNEEQLNKLNLVIRKAEGRQ